MSRHERDVVSLMAGLLLVLLAGLFLLTDLADVDLDGRWALPVVLLAVGAAGLLGTVRSTRGNRPALETTEQGAAPQDI